MSQLVEVPLAPQHLLLMTNGMDEGEVLLGKKPGEFNAGELHKSLTDFVESQSGVVSEDEAAHLGVFWAWHLVLKQGWEFVGVTRDDWDGLGVADKERRYIALPVSYFVDLFHRLNRPDRDAQPSVVYYCIANDELKPSATGAMNVVAM